MNTIEQLQTLLVGRGLLDPPVDGNWGKQSRAALAQYLRMIGREPSEVASNANLEIVRSTRLSEVDLSNGNASVIVKHMLDNEMFVSRGDGRYNIVYLEGTSESLTPNSDKPDEWNDLRLLIEIKDSKPVIIGKWRATTEPGYYYTKVKLLNPKGAFRIALGQQRAWSVGRHHNSHEALVQSKPVTGYRDFDKNFERDNDSVDTGLFGINQHWGYDLQKVGKASAGCLVGQYKTEHRKFMSLVKSDIRYETDYRYTFFTTVLDGRALFAV